MPFISQELPISMKKVQDVQQNLANTITYNQIEQKYIATAMIGRLIALKIVAKKQEEEFFKSLNLPSGIQGLQELQARLDELNKDTGFQSFIDTAIPQKEINQIINNIKFELAEDELIDVLTSSEKFRDYLKRQSTNIFSGETFTQLLNDYLRGTGPINQVHHFINSTLRGITQKIEMINLSKDKPEINWKVINKDTDKEETLTLSTSMLKRIKTVIGGKSIRDTKSQDELYNSISEILCSIVSTSKIKELIKSELTIHRKQYALNVKDNVVKGFLGELYTAVAFRLLTNQSVYPSGPIRGALNNQFLSDKKEIGIDLVVGSYGMQIKRYRYSSEDNKYVSFTNFQDKHKKLSTMLNDVPNLKLVEALSMFFASMEFNTPWQPDHEPSWGWLKNKDGTLTPAGESFWANLDIYTREVYPVFTTAYTSQSYNGVSFNNMFAQYLDRFIRADQNISNITDDAFNQMIKPFEGGITGSDPNLYVNTLFNISGKLIPTSVILDSIIEEIESQMMQQQSSKIWDYNFKINQISELQPDLTWTPYGDKNINKTSFRDLVDKFEVIYHINFNLADIYKRAIGKLE